MRTIQTFVLRLLVDADEPETLRGSLRSVTTDEGGAFADARALLRRMVTQPARTPRAVNNRTNEDSQVRQPDE